jgi:glucose/mannose transport system permease protein
VTPGAGNDSLKPAEPKPVPEAGGAVESEQGSARRDFVAAGRSEPFKLIVTSDEEEEARGYDAPQPLAGRFAEILRGKSRKPSGGRNEPRPRRPGAAIKRAILYAILFLFALWYLTPIYILLVTSLKGSSEITLDKMWMLPSSFDLGSFAEAWSKLAPNFINSLVLAIPAAILSSIVGSLNGYVLAKWKFPGADLVFTLILFGMFIPYQAILIPLTQVMSDIGLYGSLQGLMLVHIIYGIPITTLIFRNYYAGIPTELLEAAKVDGAGFIRLYRSILLPLSASGFVVVLIWQFNSVWNDFLFAVTLIPNQVNWPVTVALNNLSGSFVATWNVQMAGALIAATPTLLIFIILGRYFVRGLLAGSLKG